MSYMSKEETFRTEEIRMNNQLDRAAEKEDRIFISDCCGAPMKETDLFCPVCGNECFALDEAAMEGSDIDEEPEEDDEREQMIEDRGIDADNFSLKNMPM